jgi:hypothetical protein
MARPGPFNFPAVPGARCRRNIPRPISAAMASLLANYVALIVVIILWISVWSMAEVVGREYLKTNTDRMKFYTTAAAAASVTLILFFPQHLYL